MTSTDPRIADGAFVLALTDDDRPKLQNILETVRDRELTAVDLAALAAESDERASGPAWRDVLNSALLALDLEGSADEPARL